MTNTATITAMRTRQHGQPMEGTEREILVGDLDVFPKDHVIVARNDDGDLFAVSVFPSFRQAIKAVRILRESRFLGYGIMYVS